MTVNKELGYRAYCPALGMSPTDELKRLRDRLTVAEEQRDVAIAALETREREADERVRLLTEEQDRFVARLVEDHEKELARAATERDTLRASVRCLKTELEAARARIAVLEGDLRLARTMLDALLDPPASIRPPSAAAPRHSGPVAKRGRRASRGALRRAAGTRNSQPPPSR